MSELHDRDGGITPGNSTDQTLARLALVLRDKTQWPEGFKWAYDDCATCAMGLAVAKWGKEDNDITSESLNATVIRKFEEIVGRKCDVPLNIEYFSHKRHSFERLFFPMSHHYKTYNEVGGDLFTVSPEDVADAIDQYLLEKSGNPTAVRDEVTAST